MELERIQTPHSLCYDFGGLQSLQRLFQKVMMAIEGLEGKINSQALGAALRFCLRGSDGQAQTQGVSESAAVAAGSDRLA